MSITNYSIPHRPTCRRLVWLTFARFITCFIPNCVLYIFNLKTASSRIAWREKVALLAVYLFSATLIYVWLELFSAFFCEPEKTYSALQVFSNSSKMTGIHGKAVNWQNSRDSSAMVSFVNTYPHHDLSPNFPKFMDLSRTSTDQLYSDNILNECIYHQNRSTQADAWLNHLMETDSGYTMVDNILTACPLPTQRNVSGAPCFYGGMNTSHLNSLPMKGEVIEYNVDFISKYRNALPTPTNYTQQGYVILDGFVLDLTDYFNGATTIVPISLNISSRSFDPGRMFFPADITLYLYLNLGRDVTSYFYRNGTDTMSSLYRRCLIHLFQKGVVPDHVFTGCRSVNPALWGTMGIGLIYFLIKSSLGYVFRISFIQRILFKPPKRLDRRPHTMLVIPCFAEPSDTLRQTIDSLSQTTYDDARKLLVFVCDGIVTHAEEKEPTYALLLQCLGYSGTDEPVSQAYQSLGQHHKKTNYARVYSGYYESGRNRVPYLVVVKVGHPHEAGIRGNRGKRDSLVIVFGFLERCMALSRHLISPLEYELYNQCSSVLGIDPCEFKYLMVTDANIQVQDDVIQKLVSRLESDPRMLAVSGHVRPANPEKNLTTMLQIFPTYMTHFSGLASEACLGSVMRVNGGLVMYKVWTEQQRPKVSDEDPFRDPEMTLRKGNIVPCCVHPTVLRGVSTPEVNTMHMQNLLLLGEENIIPIVLLQSNPGHRLGFEPDAVGYTMLTTNFWTLQGVQSRVIRATLHAQLETQRIAMQIGFKFWLISLAQLMDSIFSMPIMVYLYSAFGRAILQYGMSYIIIAWAFTALATLNVLLFLLRRQYRYIVWFVLYCLLAIPLFAIWFPILAVWQSDQATYWYDTQPTTERRKRLHGIIDQSWIVEGKKETALVPVGEWNPMRRMTLAEHEVVEEERVRRAEEAALDSKFVGFSNETMRSATTAVSEPDIAAPPVAQVRKGVRSSRLANHRPSSFELWISRTEESVFMDPLEDTYYSAEDKRPSHSRSSNASQIQDESTILSTLSSSRFANLETEIEHLEDDCVSTLSITSNTFSVDIPGDLNEVSSMPRHRIVGGIQQAERQDEGSGRTRAVHNFNHSTLRI